MSNFDSLNEYITYLLVFDELDNDNGGEHENGNERNNNSGGTLERQAVPPVA
jgi:hypothetical protein